MTPATPERSDDSGIARPTLERAVGVRQYFTLAFGTIIGVGWIIFLGEWIAPAGPLGAVIGFAAGTLLMLLVGVCYAEMAAALPVSGGEMAYVYESFGAGLAFLTGWALAFVYTCTTAWEAISLGLLAESLIPGIGGAEIYSVAGSPIRAGSFALGLVMVLAITALNYRGVKWSARFQAILTVAFLLLSALFIGAGFIYGDAANLAPALRAPESGSIVAGIVAVMVTVPFFLAGFDAIPQAMEERAPGTSARAAARMIVVSILAAGGFYLLVILSGAMVLPWTELVELEGLPAAGAFQAAFASPFLGRVVLVAGILGLLTTWNAIFLAASRVVFALGRARLIPPVFGRVHARFESPSAAVLLVGSLGLLGLLLGRAAISPIVNTSTLFLSLAYGLVCWGLLRLRRTRPDLDRPYRAPGGRVTAALGVVAAGGFVFLSAREPYRGAGGRIPLEWWIVLVAVGLGAVFWLVGRRFRNEIDSEERRRLILGD